MVYINDQHYFPAKGVLGGSGPRPSNVLKYKTATKETVQLPQLCEEVFQPGERCIGINTSGGGYGDPLDRDPELVRRDVREEIVSMKRAEEVYGVVLDTGPEEYAVDHEATDRLRKKLRKERRKR
jgi:N-methylhydantoinase B